MNLDPLGEASAGLPGNRFFRVSYFPTYAVLLFFSSGSGHRFDLVDALHLAPPRDPAAELRMNRELCDLWRWGVPPALEYFTKADRPVS